MQVDEDEGNIVPKIRPSIPTLHIRQATGSTLEIPDSDDEERLEELAVDEETSYWEQLDDSLLAEQAISQQETHENLTQYASILPLPDHDNAIPELHAQAAESPDPMDLLGAIPASPPRSLPNQATSFHEMDVIQDSDEESGSFELPPRLGNIATYADYTEDSAMEPLDNTTLDVSSPPLLAQAVIVSDSDEELPSLSQTFGFSRKKAAQPATADDAQTPMHALIRTPSLGGAQAIVSTPTSSSSASDSPQAGGAAMSRPVSPPTSVEEEQTILPEEVNAGRQFRKRTAAQLQPYTTDFLKFAKNAQKRQWGDLVTREAVYGANHKAETAEEVAAKVAKLKGKKVHTHGGWLEPDSQQVPMRVDEERRIERSVSKTRPSSEDEYEAVSPRRRARSASEARRLEKGKGRGQPDGSDSDDSLPDLAFSKHRGGETIGGPASRPRKDASNQTRKKQRASVGGPSSATTSQVTLDDLEQAKKRKSGAKRKHAESGQDGIRLSRPTRAETEPPSSPINPKQPSKVRSVSSSPQCPPLKKAKGSRAVGTPYDRRHTARGFDATGASHRTPSNGHFQGFARTLSQSEEESNSEDDEEEEEQRAPGGDSPERPDAPEDRFALKGKRKKAARAMMPAIFFRKAEKDLELMREERKHGRVKDTLDRAPSGSEAEDVDGCDAARARIRINKRNANKPIRFIADESTSESDLESRRDIDSEPEQEETQLAFETWTTLAQAKNRSAEKNKAAQFGKRHWDNVIGNILVRDKLDRQAGLQKPARRKKARRRRQVAPADGNQALANRQKHTNDDRLRKKGRERQKQVDQYYTAPTHLDDGDSLFAALPPGVTMIPPPSRRQNPFRPTDRANAAPLVSRLASPARRPLIDLTRLARQAAESGASDVWSGSGSTFSRFSFDFDIKRLPPGLTFPPSSYLCKGNLHELVSLAASPQNNEQPRLRSATPFGMQLDSDMGLDVFLTMLPRLCDGIYDEITSETPPKSLTASSGEALRFSIQYMSETTIPTERQKARDSILGELEYLETRLDGWIASKEGNGSTSIHALLVFKWHMLEIAYRDYLEHADADNTVADDAKTHLLERLGELVQALVHSGLNRTMKALKSFVNQSEDEQNILEDLTCEIWVCLVHLCSLGQTDERDSLLSQANLWQLVESHLNKDAEDRKLPEVLRGEVASYAAMTISCISQFSIHGLSTSSPRLVAHWPLFSRIIDNIKPAELAKNYASMSHTARTRSSRYIWTLYARSLILATRWNWSLLEQSRMLGKLFDILNSRELQDTCIDGEAEYPSFLADFADGITTEVERDDTAFRLFLRILAKVAKEAEADGSRKALDILARISMRVMPMREKLPYPRDAKSGSTSKHRSVLVNHYSLYILLAAVDPTNSMKRFARFKAILDFANADGKARQECLKAIMYLGIVYKLKALDLSPLLSWLAEIANYLRGQYLTLAKQRVVLSMTIVEPVKPFGQNRWNGLHQQKQQQSKDKQAAPAVRQAELAKVNREMGEAAVMMGLLLGALQQMLAAGTEQVAENAMPYPSLAFLQSPWTKQVLECPMALDPVVGSQVLSFMRCFLKLRVQAMPVKAAPIARESQDEFGDFDDIDYDDPALNDMLGLHRAGSADAHQAEIDNKRAQDRQLAEIMKSDISPAIYHLLSNINVATLGQNTGVPEIPDREGYISELVETWTGCALVLVQNDMREWSYYMSEFGKESWHRVGDSVARYEIGLHFASGMLRNDESAYKTFRDQCIEVLFRSLSAPSILSAAASYLSQLLNIDSDLLLWRRLPFSTEPITNSYEISESRLHDRRMAVLREMFKNSKDTILGRLCRPPPIVIDVEADGDAPAEDMDQEDIRELAMEQNLSRPLIYRLLGNMCSSMRDNLDAFKQKREEGSFKAERYSKLCKEIGRAMQEELGIDLANEKLIPQLRLLAGVMA